MHVVEDELQLSDDIFRLIIRHVRLAREQRRHRQVANEQPLYATVGLVVFLAVTTCQRAGSTAAHRVCA